MKRIAFTLDDRLAARLEHVAPAASRRRSEFVRRVLTLALDEIDEAKIADAYRERPQTAEDLAFDPNEWPS